MDSLYKLMVDTAERFQFEYKNKGTRDKWYPRLNSIVDICIKDIKSISDSEIPEIQVMVEAANHYMLEDESGALRKGLKHEHIYFMFLMNRKYALKWNFFLNDWLELGSTVQQYCIRKKIPLYAICTDPLKRRTILRQKLSFDIDELLEEIPIKKEAESGFQWYICNFQHYNIKLYHYHPIDEEWQKITRQ